MSRPETIVYIATTADGFIARLDDGIDWLEHDAKGSDYGWETFRASIDGLVLGRRTYEQVIGFDVGWPYVGLKTVVMSRTLDDGALAPVATEHGVTTSGASPADVLEALGNAGAERVWIDGGGVITSFVEAGLIDLVTVTRIPVLIGQGIPLFGALTADVRLDHVVTSSFESGVVQSTYRVA